MKYLLTDMFELKINTRLIIVELLVFRQHGLHKAVHLFLVDWKHYTTQD